MAHLQLTPYQPHALRRTAGGLLYHCHRGTMLPPFLHPPAMDALRDSWDSGANDILICTPQKVGTHLAKKFVVEVLLALELLEESHPCAKGDIGHGAIPWPEVVISQQGWAGWKQALARSGAGPRIWYTHASYLDLPLRSLHPQTRLLLVEREPKDALVSQYFFYRTHPHLGADARHTLASYGEDFLAGRTYFGDYHAHLRGWLERPDGRLACHQLLRLRYSAMVGEKAQVVRQLQAFLAPERPISSAALDTIVARTEFQAMKQALALQPGTFHFQVASFFRSGTVGDWKHHLHPELAERVDAKTKREWDEPWRRHSPPAG